MTDGAVDVWTIPLDAPRALILSPDEQARAVRFRFEDARIRWSRARSALRAILAGSMGLAPEDLRFDAGPHGKPALANDARLYFNVSHSGDWAMIAVTRAAAVGIDIERVREKVDIVALLRRIGESDLPAARPELFQAWARREAKSKAGGGPLLAPPAAEVRVTDLAAPPGYAAALALVGMTPVVRCRGGESPV